MSLKRKKCKVEGCDRWCESKGIGASGKRIYRTVCTIHHRSGRVELSREEIYERAMEARRKRMEARNV